MRLPWPAGILGVFASSACDRGTAPPPPAPAPVPALVIVAPPDASPDAPTMDAGHPIPPPIQALAAAPAWHARSLMTGQIRAVSELTFATLNRVDDRAMLTLEVQTAVTHLRDDALDPWTAKAVSRRYTGAEVTAAGVTTFNLFDGTDHLTLACKPTKVAVAKATAVRKRDPKKESCTGDQGHWVPAPTMKANALVCGDPGDELAPGYAFTAPDAPAIEWVYVNDDCVMQGGGYRAIAADGSFAPFR